LPVGVDDPLGIFGIGNMADSGDALLKNPEVGRLFLGG
jgi:hypothetical protein